MFSQVTGQSQVQFKPESLLGNRSYNYQHIINAEVSKKIHLTNFTYIDSDYILNGDLYNFRIMGSYSFYEHWSANIAMGLKNPGFYTTVSAQFKDSFRALSYVISTGLTFQDGLTSESFGSVSYVPAIRRNIKAFLRSSFSLNIDNKGVTRGIQQFRLGLSLFNLTIGFASNFDQFNYGQMKLYNHGIFTIITL